MSKSGEILSNFSVQIFFPYILFLLFFTVSKIIRFHPQLLKLIRFLDVSFGKFSTWNSQSLICHITLWFGTRCGVFYSNYVFVVFYYCFFITVDIKKNFPLELFSYNISFKLVQRYFSWYQHRNGKLNWFLMWNLFFSKLIKTAT